MVPTVAAVSSTLEQSLLINKLLGARKDVTCVKVPRSVTSSSTLPFFNDTLSFTRCSVRHFKTAGTPRKTDSSLASDSSALQQLRTKDPGRIHEEVQTSQLHSV